MSDASRVPSTTRRRLVQALVALPGFAALALWQQRGRGLDFMRTPPATRSLVKDYPTPAYLPRGYEFAKAQKGRSLGFRPHPENQLTLWALNDRRERLMVVVAPAQDGMHLYSRKQGTPRVLSVRTNRGESIRAEYFDGRAKYIKEGDRFEWDSTGEHAMVADWRGYKVAVVGHRNWGIDRTELIRVIASLS